MKKLLIILLIITFGWQCAQSQDNTPAFRFIWNEANYLFYDTYDLQHLSFQYSIPAENISMAAGKVGVIEKVQTDKGSGIVYFKENPSPSDIRKFAEEIGIKEIYINDTRILTSTLLDKKEAYRIGKKTQMDTKPSSDINGNKATGEDISMNIYLLNLKLTSMQMGDYPRYLYAGYVTKYTEELENYKSKAHKNNIK